MKKLLLVFAVLVTVNGFAQDNFWQKIDKTTVSSREKLPRDSNTSTFEVFSLNLEALKMRLSAAPSRLSGITSNVIISFPNELGQLEEYQIYEASVMQSELAARHQEIQSYVGKGVKNPTSTIRFSTTLFGLHVMNFSDRGTSYIDPYTKDLTTYMVYNKSTLTTNKYFECSFNDNEVDDLNVDMENTTLLRSDNSLFKTYRLALACTIEYAAYHVNAAGLNPGTLAQKKAAVLAAMVVTMTRVNGVYERDLALTMVLINNNDLIINITSDTYSNNDGFTLLDENQAAIDATIGSANYDIGHVCSTGGGGVAQLQSPCGSSKARGVTGLGSPVGDAYDIDYVAHEMGHQWGGNHTFNSVAGSCNGNRTSSSAYEPGSGTTIMAYAGICSPEDVQQHSDAYFHARSLIQMMAFINAGGNCGVAVANGNTAPVIVANPTVTIPNGTAFSLTGSATDVDNPSGNQLTYCWEHYNFTGTSVALVSTNTSGPNFRSYTPTSSPTRYFPPLASVLAGNLAPAWEVVPTVARSTVFSLVVRDNGGPMGGQTQRATTNVVFASTGPFKVTSQNASVAWVGGASETITWDIAGTNAAPINTATVTIKLSTDGGLTFPITLAANTPNDGSQAITVPTGLTSQTCRLMILADGNIYYAVNSAPFYIGYAVSNLCTTYNYTGAAFSIPDGSNSYTIRSINVPNEGTISDVNVTINATHPNIQNLIIDMIRPGGGISSLYNQQCMGSANMNITFDAQGSPLVCASPTSGTYVPPTGFDMNTFNINIATGNWQFGFKDLVAGNVGTINSIALEVCRQVFTPLANEQFNFENFALYPNPNTGSFNIQFDSKSNQKITVEVNDISGRKIYEKGFANTGFFNQNIELNNTQTGVYLVSITDGSSKIVKRIIVE